MSRAFYARDTVAVALDLLGRTLWHTTTEDAAAGRIVEVEAYLESDPASHAFRGPTPRTRLMWEKPGVAYIYLNYGVHYCMNLVAEKAGRAGCILLRALEPTEGIELMAARRGTTDLMNLTNGPGKLTQALGITTAHNGVDITRGGLVVRETRGADNTFEVAVTSRIGISTAECAPLRFFVAQSEFVSQRNSQEIFCRGTVKEIKTAFLRGDCKFAWDRPV